MFNKELLTYLLHSTSVEASAMNTKHKRTGLCLADKVKVVNMLDENKSHTEIATKLVIVL